MNVRYYPLINKLINTFDIRQKLSLSDDQDIIFKKPFITIAREPGSGGRPIAQMVAKKLGFKFIDKLIIDEIAHSTQKRKEIIAQVDEKSRTWITNMTHRLLNQEFVDESEYMTELVKIIITYGLKGNVVILGRGANFILPFDKGLHVSITAPKKVRIDRAIKYEGYSKKKAVRVVEKYEKERRDFVQQYLNFDLTKTNSYDLCLNTTDYELKQSRDIIIEAFKQKFHKKIILPISKIQI